MAINKISGNILADNLVRGSNLAIQSNLVYFDVTNNRVGVGTNTPADTLSVIGVANASNVRITSATANGIFYADTNKLALTTANLTWNGTVLSVIGNVAAGNVIASNAVIGNVDVGNITVSGNISVESLSANLFVTANGNVTGSNLISNAGIFGTFANITGNINAGNIIVGNIVLDGATGNINMNNAWINNLADPVQAQDAATKNYVDNEVANVSFTITDSALNSQIVTNGDTVTFAGTANEIDVVVSATDTVTVGLPNDVTVTNNLTVGGNIDVTNNYVLNLANPLQASDAATKQYVDDAVSSGIHIHTPVYVETPVPLPSATYAQGGNTFIVTDTIAGNTVVFSTAANLQVNDQLWFANSFNGVVANLAYFVVSTPNTSAAVLTTVYNGVPVSNISNATGLTESVRVNSGIGATLTATANGALTIDSVAVSSTQRVLVYQQANAVQNGVYVVTDTGNVTSPWILTRSSDTDTYEPDTSSGLDQGSYFYVQAGASGAGESYVKTAPAGPFIIGQANIEFTQFSASQVYSANTSAGISLIGTVFSAKVDNNTTSFDIGGNIIVKAGANLTTPNIGVATGTSLSVTGNVTGGNLTTAGIVTATGNIIGGNIATAGLITATGNITGGNLISAGNADVGGIRTDNYYYANGAPVDFQQPAGANTQIQFNSNNDFGASANLTFDQATNVLQVGNGAGGSIQTDNISATGNVIAASANISGQVIAGTLQTTGNAVIGGNLFVQGNVSYINVETFDVEDPIITIGTGANDQPLVANDGKDRGVAMDYYNTALSQQQTAFLGWDNSTGNLILAANVTIANEIVTITEFGTLQAGNGYLQSLVVIGNIDAGNISTLGNVQGDYILANSAIIGNVSITDLSVANIDATGYANIAGNITGGNLNTSGNVSTVSVLASGLISATGNITGGNIQTSGTLTATGTATLGNVGTAGVINATGNITGGNILSNSLISGANVQVTTLTANRVVYVGADDYLVDNANLTFDGSSLRVVGNVVIDNITIDGTDITSNANITVQASGNGNITLTPAGNGLVIIDTITGLVLPQGNTAQRPSPAVEGTMRWNSASLQVEVYDGTAWEDVGSEIVAISDQTLNGDGLTVNFTLDQATLANNIIVSTNGVVQKPGVSYSVTGNLLTFTEAPQISDTVDVRFIATLTTVNAITNSGGNSISIDDSGVANAASVQSLQLPTYTVAQTTGLANVANGQVIYVSNGDSGSPCLAVYSVNAWKRVSLGANIST
jgi:hypothetical protein